MESDEPDEVFELAAAMLDAGCGRTVQTRSVIVMFFEGGANFGK